jgi:PAS domain S-box-containing protein
VPHTRNPAISACLSLTRAISGTRTVDEIYEAALGALGDSLGVTRAAILLFDADGIMRFKAWRGLSDEYRGAAEGHSPWTPDTVGAETIAVADVKEDPSLSVLRAAILSEGIASLAIVPLVTGGRVIGKFMLYYSSLHAMSAGEIEIAEIIAAQVVFAVARTRAEEQARQNEERLRFALDAANMGTWDWDLAANTVRWSDNLERIHGLPPATFDGSFSSYEHEIHPDDREGVLASAGRAIEQGVPHDVEYRIVAPDGTVRWVEGKGRVEYAEDGHPARMTGVCMDVTRRKNAEAAKLEAAHEASRLKDEFLAVLSHELRTPLNAILGWVHMLQSGTLSTASSAEAIRIISRNAKLQAQLIEDILDVSRIMAGMLQLDRRPLAVPQIVEGAVSAVLPVAAAKGIHLVVEGGADIPPVDADAQRLQQVLGNLLSNALKFTPEGGQVTVRCGRTLDGVDIEVQDTGVGIEPEFLPFVFERFRQADSRSTRRHGGLGLGLAIAQHLVRQHDGKLSVSSQGVGCGATFRIWLPAAPATTAGAGASPGGTPGTAEASLARVRILVVDDDPDARHLLEVLLGGHGATVLAADGAAAAIAAFEGRSFDIMIADIAMPDIDGYQLVRSVKAEHPTLATIALTARARPEDRSRAFAAGYDAHEPKPFDPNRLVSTVRSLVRPTAPPLTADV